MDEPRWRTAGIAVDALTGKSIDRAIPDVARLRIAIFRDFPYLYDGDPDYERRYLAGLGNSPRSIVIVARDGDRIVGASTGAPLAEVEDDWVAPFVARGESVADRFYCAESVLMPASRGLGIGHAFFDLREAHARALGLSKSCFCSVIRPKDHPARPDSHRTNDAFWNKRGYRPLDGIVAKFAWRDIGDEAETEKELQFWGRDL